MKGSWNEMISHEKAKELVLKSRPGRVIDAAYRLPDGYLFAAVPKGLAEDDYVFDAFSKVAAGGTIEEYSPVLNPEEFKKALKNRIE